MALSAFQTEDFGLMDYETVWRMQKDRVQQRLAGEIPDTLMLGEHPPVITLGRGSHAENLLSPTIPVLEIERGGDVTYHGPGQLIAYPIFLLPEGQRDLHRYLRNLEEVILRTLADFGLESTRNPGWTGAWVKDSQNGQRLKIASIGVAVKKWVTYHGIALNVNTDLAPFRQINPCGLKSHFMTSMQALLGHELKLNSVKDALFGHFKAIFPENEFRPTRY